MDILIGKLNRQSGASPSPRNFDRPPTIEELKLLELLRASPSQDHVVGKAGLSNNESNASFGPAVRTAPRPPFRSQPTQNAFQTQRLGSLYVKYACILFVCIQENLIGKAIDCVLLLPPFDNMLCRITHNVGKPSSHTQFLTDQHPYKPKNR